MKENLRIIISGGGTGGHIYPAISIANALKQRDKNIEILFVGAEGKMEMEKVPAAGYKIVGLPIRGFQRKINIQNLKNIFNLFVSLKKARKIINNFKPNAVVGVGGYASGPTLHIAAKKGIPVFIQEQNSYAGVTNKLLAKKASKIFVAYEGMEKFFPADKIILTGNPVRKDLLEVDNKKNEAIDYFKTDANKKTILILGGSLGARTINQSVLQNLDVIAENETQIIWQTGKLYYNQANTETKKQDIPNLKTYDFITRMDLAYALADVVISRAGAGTISELCLVKKPSILVPSPNVAEDHQTKNAMALVRKDAAIMVKDIEAREILIETALELINKSGQLEKLSRNIEQMAKHDSANKIANEILLVASKNS